MATIPLGQGSETEAQKEIDKSTVYVQYSLFHINWCRLCIRVSAKKSRGKNLIGALEVSYRPTDTKFFPLSAKQKAD